MLIISLNNYCKTVSRVRSFQIEVLLMPTVGFAIEEKQYLLMSTEQRYDVSSSNAPSFITPKTFKYFKFEHLSNFR